MAPNNGGKQSLFSNTMSDLDMAFDGHLLAQTKPNPVKKRTPYKKGKTKKPKGMPIKNLSAYNLFFKEQRTLIVEERTVALGQFTARGRRVKAKIPFEELARIIGARWKGINPGELKRYQRLADEDKVRFEREMKVYLNSTKRLSEAKNRERPSSTPPPRSSSASYGPEMETPTLRSSNSFPISDESSSLRSDNLSWTPNLSSDNPVADVTESDCFAHGTGFAPVKHVEPDGQCVSFSGKGLRASGTGATILPEQLLIPEKLSRISQTRANAFELQYYDCQGFTNLLGSQIIPSNGFQFSASNPNRNHVFSQISQQTPELIPSTQYHFMEQEGEGGHNSHLTSSIPMAGDAISESTRSTSSTSLFDIFDQLGYGGEDFQESCSTEPNPVHVDFIGARPYPRLGLLE